MRKSGKKRPIVELSKRRDLYVVGVGASAGGLEALEALFRSLPSDTGMAFVVIQHLSPDFKSHMEELLAKHTTMPIYRVENGMPVEANCIYLIPAKMEMVISEGKLLLTAKSKERVLSHPIDQFFRSLASDFGRKSVGVILSGTGSDGSRGIRDISEAGGLTVTQDESSAKFDGMPMNAQSTGAVNLVLPPAGIAKALVKYAEQGLSPEGMAEQDLESNNFEGMEKIFYLLHQQHGLDFSQYKTSTVGRRIQRRVDLLTLESLTSYVEYIQSNPEEVNLLYRDLLIGVTKFFRDPDAFAVLENNVIPTIFSRLDDYPTIRVWVAGCASGEEAYSIAILFDEEIRRRQSPVNVKIFATDAHHVSLQSAAQGVYSLDALSELSKERREFYFRKRRDGFHVTRELRRYIVFAPHNLIRDAPFTQLDLVTCRNLLIYLQPQAQKKALAMFHFALKSGGTLFLGPSESPGDIADEFQILDKRWRVYSKRRDVRVPIESISSFGLTVDRISGSRSLPATMPKPRIDPNLLAIYDQILDRRMPRSFLVNANFEIMHVFSGAEKYLKPRGGRPTNSLLDSIVEPLKTPLTVALQNAARKQIAVRYAGIHIQSGNGIEDVRLIIEPVFEPKSKTECLLVELEPADAKTESLPEGVSVDLTKMSRDRVSSLESELHYTQENLQATVEEMETANEELQASNEELVASNEELQSTNEELHSVNEELYTVNAEHQRRVEELAQATADMDNLLATTRVGVIFLDDDLYIRRFTPEIAKLFHLVPQDIGRSIEGFSHNLNRDKLIEDLKRVISTQEEVEIHVEDKRGVPYLLRILPYRTHERADGVVLTLIDISSLKAAQANLEQFKFMTEAANDAIALLGRNGELSYVNPTFRQMLGYTTEELNSMTITGIERVNGLLHFQALFDGTDSAKLNPYKAEWLRRDKTTVSVEVSASRFVFEGHQFLCINARDISERVISERNLNIQHLAMESARHGILMSDATLPDRPITYVNSAFTELTGYSRDEAMGRNCRFLQGNKTDREEVKIVRDAIAAGKACQVTLLNYRKDGTTFWNELQITPVKDESGKLTHFIGMQNDITARIHSENALKANAEKTQTILDTTAEGIYGVDQNGFCTFCNESALKLLGFSLDEVVGHNMHKLIHHSTDVGETLCERDCKIQGAIVSRNEIHVSDEVFWRKDGSSFPVEYWSRPLVRDGEIQGAVVSFQDISVEREWQKRQKQILQELEQANRAALKASDTKSEFLANMSHEIRTPMSAIMGYADILARHLDDADNLNCVQIIRDNGKFLLEIISDILDISKIEAGKIDLVKEAFQLPELLADLRALMRIRAREKGLNFHFETDGKLPRAVISDAKRLKQILLNLIGNAIKFTDTGTVKVVVRFLSTRKLHRLQFEVIDTGIGISHAQTRRLFHPFTQADASVVRRYGGTGLGLAISQRLAEMLGGKITVRSALERGSKFTLTVRVKIAENVEFFERFEDRPLNGPQDLLEDLPQVKGCVLVVDDRRDVRFVAQHFIEQSGGIVLTAENGREAVELIMADMKNGRTIDLVVMDMQMPVLDGYAATKILREKGFSKPVIALTAHAMEGDREKCLAAGCNDYLPKPLEKGRFVRVLNNLISANAASLSPKVDRPNSPAASSRTAQTVLIIDDSKDAAHALATLLEFDGYRAVVETRGRSGVARAAELKPEVILLDLGLPDISGIEVCGLLRANAELKKTLVVAVTGDSVDATMNSEFDGHIVKPVNMQELHRLIGLNLKPSA